MPPSRLLTRLWIAAACLLSAQLSLAQTREVEQEPVSPCDSAQRRFYALLNAGQLCEGEETAWLVYDEEVVDKCRTEPERVATCRRDLASALRRDIRTAEQYYMTGNFDRFDSIACRHAQIRLKLLLALAADADTALLHGQQLFWAGLEAAVRHDSAGIQAGLAAFRASQTSQPASALPLNAEGELLLSAGRFAEALEVLKKAARLASDWASPCENMGVAWVGLQQPDSARRAFAQALLLDDSRLHLHEIVANPKQYTINLQNIFLIEKTINPEKNNTNLSSKIVLEANGIPFTMVYIPAGSFLMGSSNGGSDESPAHTVQLSSFYLGETEITLGLWRSVMGYSYRLYENACSECPINDISWNETRQFINVLNKLTGKTFRLPTEAEWEYAAGGGAGNRTLWAGTLQEKNLNRYAHYARPARETPYPVKTLSPNYLGLYDMSGNVWEWCADWYEATYPAEAQTNPAGPDQGSGKVLRGGSWNDNAGNVRITTRSYFNPANRSPDIGLRLVLAAE